MSFLQLCFRISCFLWPYYQISTNTCISKFSVDFLFLLESYVWITIYCLYKFSDNLTKQIQDVFFTQTFYVPRYFYIKCQLCKGNWGLSWITYYPLLVLTKLLKWLSKSPWYPNKPGLDQHIIFITLFLLLRFVLQCRRSHYQVM